jgi:hypothetical protein
MTDLEKEILSALVELEDNVKRMPTANPKPDLGALFQRLDQLALRLPPGTDKDLVHYLRRKSYQKARLFLEGRDAENTRGGCAHV